MARRSSAASFSRDRTRIFRFPSSMDRKVSSRYLTLRGCVTAIFTSFRFNPVAFPSFPRFCSNSDPACATSSVLMNASTNGCDSFPMSKDLSRPLPIPSIDAKARKMNVNAGGNLKTVPPLSSVSVCKSLPSVSLMLPFCLPNCVFLKERMKKRASFSTARRSALLDRTPIFSTAVTRRLAFRARSMSEMSGPPSKSALQNSRKPSCTLGRSSFIMPKS
mmetsp:Transcript_2744/g.11289  ORF Transcript_2744/g.11289 Transcript_2744/m.11289 type:complete len:219 (+) Transcript_2744:1180-1836(+)